MCRLNPRCNCSASTTGAYRPCTALTHHILWLSSALSATCAVLIHYATVVLGRVCKRLQPEQDHADVDHGEIVVATLLIPRTDAPGLLESLHHPLDFVA